MTEPVVLLGEAEVALAVTACATEAAAWVDDETVAVCLLTGGLWFAADFLRALSRLGRSPLFDALWVASYGDERTSAGSVQVRAGLQRPAHGRKVLIVDDVFDTGASLIESVAIVRAAGAGEVRTAVFARKPWPADRGLTPDYVAWEAPARYLVGYGMDAGGRHRGLPFVGALD